MAIQYEGGVMNVVSGTGPEVVPSRANASLMFVQLHSGTGTIQLRGNKSAPGITDLPVGTLLTFDGAAAGAALIMIASGGDVAVRWSRWYDDGGA